MMSPSINSSRTFSKGSDKLSIFSTKFGLISSYKASSVSGGNPARSFKIGMSSSIRFIIRYV